MNPFQVVYTVELCGLCFCFTKQRLLTVEDVNCICVDWSKGSKCQYTQASNNIRVVGAEIAYFVNVLMVSHVYMATVIMLIWKKKKSDSGTFMNVNVITKSIFFCSVIILEILLETDLFFRQNCVITASLVNLQV